MTCRRRWPVVLAVIGTLAVTGGALLGRAGSSSGRTTSATIDDRESQSAAPAVQAEPSGGEVVDAALQLVAAPQRWLYLNDDQLASAVRAVSSPRAADRLVADVTADVTPVRDALRQSAGPVWWVVRPLAWRIEALSSDGASVLVWAVSILSAADVAVPQSDWFTIHLDLERVDGQWLLVATSDEPGPTPQLGGRDEAWQPEPFDDALGGFTRVGEAAAP